MFRGVIDFMGDLGIYDVVLPFLLVFTVTFAILEKSKIFGTFTVGKEEVTRKNLNSMVAFVLGFIAVASSKVVGIINQGLANIMIVMICIFAFLLLAGALFVDGDSLFKDSGFIKLRFPLVVITLIVTILIFLNAIKNDDGKSWLDIGWNFISKQWDSTLVGSVILLAMMAGFVYIITKDKKPEKKEP